MSSDVLEVCLSADIHQFCFQAVKLSGMDFVEVQGRLFADFQECHFRSRIVQIIALTYCKWVDLLIFTKAGFRVRNVGIWAVLSNNEVDLLMLRNRVFRQRNDQKYALYSWKYSIYWYSGNMIWGLGKFTYGLSRPVVWSICWITGIAFIGFETIIYE